MPESKQTPDLPCSTSSVVQYPKGDVRRPLAVMAALDSMGSASLSDLANFTGYNKGSIPAYVQVLRSQFGVAVNKSGSRYMIESWGTLLNPQGVRQLISGQKKTPL